jgi:hypothetical protein
MKPKRLYNLSPPSRRTNTSNPMWRNRQDLSNTMNSKGLAAHTIDSEAYDVSPDCICYSQADKSVDIYRNEVESGMGRRAPVCAAWIRVTITTGNVTTRDFRRRLRWKVQILGTKTALSRRLITFATISAVVLCENIYYFVSTKGIKPLTVWSSTIIRF